MNKSLPSTLAAAGALSGLLYAVLARLTDGFRLDVGPFRFEYFAILFLVSAVLRFSAYRLLLPGVEPEAAPDLAAKPLPQPAPGQAR